MDIYFINGTILSIILSYWGIWHANKTKAKVDLSLVDVSWIPLVGVFNDKSQQLKRLNYILPFASNQYYYAGTIINTGNTDIHKSLVFKPVTISFDSEVKIVSLGLLDSFNVNAKCTQRGNDLILEWDILKPLEKFSFEMIIESSKNTKLFRIGKRLQLDSRIADLHQINRLELDEMDSFKKEFFNSYLPTFSFILVLLGFGFYMLYSGASSFKTPKNVLTYEVVSKITKEPIIVQYHTRDSLKLTYGERIDTIPNRLLNSNVLVRTEVSTVKDRYWVIILGLILVLIMLFAIYRNLKDISETNRLRGIFEVLRTDLP